jgi:Carboxypeptidase regulatory-like domain
MISMSARGTLNNRWIVTAVALVIAGGLTASSGLAQGQGGGAAGGQAVGGQGRGQGGGRAQGGGGRGQQARDNTQPPTIGTGSIDGTVSNEVTGGPVRRARVTLSGAELRGGRSAVTDDQGAFSFTALPAGRFTMTASKAGYVDIQYGAKRPGRPGTPVELAEGQKLEKANITLPKGSVITGIVVDENGEPAPGTQVRVLKYVMRTGEKTLQQSGQDQTDDRGMYRIYALQPGDYMVSAIPRNFGLDNLRQTITTEIQALLQQAGAGAAAGRGGRGGANQAAGLANLLGGAGGAGAAQNLLDRASQLQQQLQQSDQEQTVAYAPVYYPGTPVASAAATVTLAVGEERAGVDFQLQLVPTARIDGSVVSPDGTMPPGTQISLISAGQEGMPLVPGAGMNMARPNPDGHFTFQGVTPGQYRLMARAAIRDPNTDPQAGGRGGGRGGLGGRGGVPSEVLWASTDISVGGQNLENIVLSLQPGMTVSGRIVFAGTSTQAPTDLTRVRVNLSARGQQLFNAGGVPPAQVDETGRFTITGVAPGTYAISANSPGGGGGRGAAPTQGGGQWTLKSVIVGGQDALDIPFEVRPNEDVGGIVVTFNDRQQQLSGTIQDAVGRPTSDFTIIVFPSDTRYWLPQARRIASTRPSTDGKFSFRNLPPGDYRLTAVTDVEPGEWYDPAFLSQLGGASIPISLVEGESKVQDIRLAGGGGSD